MDPDPDSCLALAAVPLAWTFDPGLMAALLAFFLLLVCSALISGSEVAYFSISLPQLEKLREDRRPSSRTILSLLERPATLLATILISNNFVNVSIVMVADPILQRMLPVEQCVSWAIELQVRSGLSFSPEVWGRGFHFALTVLGVTFLLVLMGEIMPKIYARMNVLKLARFMARPLTVLAGLFSPVTGIMVRWTDVLERRMEHLRSDLAHSSSELQSAIELTVRDIDSHERKEVDILKRIIQFADVNVKQIMRPRTDIIAIDREDSFADMMAVVRSSGYSRIPVFGEDLDHITGIIYAKDLLGHLQEPDDFDWGGLVRTEVLYVPESKRINDLLKEFQKERRHMAIVVDEYGGTAGLVTLEDIMEEIIGEIKDEFDDEAEIQYQQLDERNYLFEGKAQIQDLCRIVGIPVNAFDEVKGDADSVAGLILELAGVIPRKDTVVEHRGFTFRVTKVNRRRIEEIKITLPSPK